MVRLGPEEIGLTLFRDLYAQINEIKRDDAVQITDDTDNNNYERQMSLIDYKKFDKHVRVLSTYIINQDLVPSVSAIMSEEQIFAYFKRERLSTEVRQDIYMRAVINHLRSLSYINGQMFSQIVTRVIDDNKNAVTPQSILSLMSAGYDGTVFDGPQLSLQMIDQELVTIIAFSFTRMKIGFRDRVTRETVSASTTSNSVLNINLLIRLASMPKTVTWFELMPPQLIQIRPEEVMIDMPTDESNMLMMLPTFDITDPEVKKIIFKTIIQRFNEWMEDTDEEMEEWEMDEDVDNLSKMIEQMQVHVPTLYQSDMTIETFTSSIMSKIIISDRGHQHPSQQVRVKTINITMLKFLIYLLRQFSSYVVNTDLLNFSTLYTKVRTVQDRPRVNPVLRLMLMTMITDESIRTYADTVKRTDKNAETIIYQQLGMSSSTVTDLIDAVLSVVGDKPMKNVLAYYIFKHFDDGAEMMDSFMSERDKKAILEKYYAQPVDKYGYIADETVDEKYDVMPYVQALYDQVSDLVKVVDGPVRLMTEISNDDQRRILQIASVM